MDNLIKMLRDAAGRLAEANLELGNVRLHMRAAARKPGSEEEVHRLLELSRACESAVEGAILSVILAESSIRLAEQRADK